MCTDGGLVVGITDNSYIATSDGISWFIVGARASTDVAFPCSAVVMPKLIIMHDGKLPVEKGPEYDTDVFFKVPAMPSPKPTTNFYFKGRS